MNYSVETPIYDELAEFARKHAEFIGLQDPESYVKNRMSTTTRAQIDEELPYFRVIKFDDHPVVGAYMHPGGWLSNLFVEKGHEEAFDLLLKDLSTLEDKYYVSFRSMPPNVQQVLQPILEKNNYQLTNDHDLQLNLIDFPEIISMDFIPQVWSDDLDTKFQEIYTKYHHDPWPWDVIKHQTGGGLFASNLWFIHPDGLGIVAINRPRKEVLPENHAFNIVVLLGEKEITKSLSKYAIWQCGQIDPIGVINVHCLDKQLEFYQEIGFKIRESHRYYYPIGHKMFV